MEELVNNRWNTIPKHIAVNIVSYLPLVFQMELRLVNRHWKSSLNSLVFHSIDDFKPEKVQAVIQAYGTNTRVITNTSVQTLDLSTLKQSCPNITCIKLALLKPELDISLKLIQSFNNLEQLEIQSYIEFNKPSNPELERILNSAHKLKSLHYSNFSSQYKFKHSLPKLSSLSNLKKLTINSSSLSLEGILNEYKILKNLRHIKQIVNYHGNKFSLQERKSLLTPNILLIHNTLKYISLWNYTYSDDGDSIETYLSHELVKLFSNPMFSNLISFEWMFLWSDNLVTNIIFTSPLPKTQNWLNLSKLSLFIIDEFLLTYIIEHCQNLVELVSFSPLTPPNCSNPLKLNPLKKLKRLQIGGFDKKIINNENIICYLFPSIETLNANLKLDNSTNQVIMDAYYIPLLFPILKFCMLRSFKYNLSNLINNHSGILQWKEVYIMIAFSNMNLLEALLDKLPLVKLIYLNMDSNINLPFSKRQGIRYFQVYWSDEMGFDFKIIKEI